LLLKEDLDNFELDESLALVNDSRLFANKESGSAFSLFRKPMASGFVDCLLGKRKNGWASTLPAMLWCGEGKDGMEFV